MVAKPAFKLIWDKRALKQLEDILDYLSTQSKDDPFIVKSAIVNRLEIIRKSPLVVESDKLKDPLNSNFRAFVVFNYRITYQIELDRAEIRILRVRHTSREPLGY